MRVQLLGDYDPAGEEYDLVYNVTGKLIPPGGIPIAVLTISGVTPSLAHLWCHRRRRFYTSQLSSSGREQKL